jgi:hypothetical protein
VIGDPSTQHASKTRFRTRRARRFAPRVSAVVLASAWASAWAPPAAASVPDAPDSLINDRNRPVALKLHAEIGFLAPLSHRLQFGSEGTYLDVRKDLGQDTLFFFGRLSGDLDIGRSRRHTVVLLWQPLDLRSRAISDRDLRIEDETLTAGTPIDFRYGFPFWRISYLFDVLRDDDREVAFGLGLQIRNANIELATDDGSVLRSSRDIGPVPLLKFRGFGFLRGRFWMGGEVDGFYAPVRYLNAARSDVEGAIVDSSLRFGLAWKNGIDTFLNLRYLAGGARGTASRAEPFSDGFTRNWLHFFTVSIGFSLR